MKEQFIKIQKYGFTTLELLIALALMSVVLVGAIEAIGSAEYWFITAQTANEALNKNKSIIHNLENISIVNFQQVSSTLRYISQDVAESSDQSCIDGGLCYDVEIKVSDVSSCAKEVLVSVYWQIGARYPTSSVSSKTYLSNTQQILAAGGDCVTEFSDEEWQANTPELGSQINLPAQGNTGIDVLGDYMYVTSMTAPFLRIFKIFDQPSNPPVLVGSSEGSGVRLNDIDVILDYSTGRIYAYVMQHSTTSQLAVFDVTESNNPVLLTQLPLLNVASAGSFPQGWRVIAYGGQLFVVSRETMGPELHIFSIENPRVPIEISTAPINLNRTVNDMVVRDEMIGNNKRRFLYLAASSDLKELGVYDVTGAVPIEIAAINLTGSADAASLYLTGNILYVGRRNSTAPELYAFASEKLIQNELQVLGTSEVGAEVLALGGVGDTLVVGTGKSDAELQIWSRDTKLWNPTVINSGQLSVVNSSDLAPLGFDNGLNNLYLLSGSLTQPETLSVIYSP